MVIDTSAVLAIFLGEPERKQFLDLILQSGKRLISAASVLEVGIVLDQNEARLRGASLIYSLFERTWKLRSSMRNKSRLLVLRGGLMGRTDIPPH